MSTSCPQLRAIGWVWTLLSLESGPRVSQGAAVSPQNPWLWGHNGDTLTGSTLVLSTWDCRETKAGGISHTGMDLQQGQGCGLSCFGVRVPQNTHLPWSPACREANLVFLYLAKPGPPGPLFWWAMPKSHPLFVCSSAAPAAPQKQDTSRGVGLAVGTQGWQWGHGDSGGDVSLAAGTWEPWICPEICITWETPEK